MAETEEECNSSSLKGTDELVKLVWGKSIKEDVFERWSQGIYFPTYSTCDIFIACTAQITLRVSLSPSGFLTILWL